jgi:tetratricopeptide (TPR) repeat protein
LSKTDVEKSLEYFEKSIALDPRFAPAHAGLADSYVLLGVLYLRRPREVFPKARTFAERALEFDGTLASAHRSMAVIRNLYDWDWKGSEGGFRRALALDPNLVGAHQGYSVLLSCLRRYEEATREILEARELDPVSLVINGLVGFIHMRARQYDRAIAECLKAIELDPNHPFGHWLLARSLDAANQAKDALVEARAAEKLSGHRLPYSSHLGYAFARAGQLDAAKKVLEGLAERGKTEYVSPYDFAHIYIALGEVGLAFDWLDKSCEEKVPQLSGELWEPIFDQVRDHPRFSCVMRQIGLVPLQ